MCVFIVCNSMYTYTYLYIKIYIYTLETSSAEIVIFEMMYFAAIPINSFRLFGLILEMSFRNNECAHIVNDSNV